MVRARLLVDITGLSAAGRERFGSAMLPHQRDRRVSVERLSGVVAELRSDLDLVDATPLPSPLDDAAWSPLVDGVDLLLLAARPTSDLQVDARGHGVPVESIVWGETRGHGTLWVWLDVVDYLASTEPVSAETVPLS